jgi:hypothetical protein
MVTGDGTWQTSYSRVTEIKDSNGVPVGYSGSRAKSGNPRGQRIRHKGQMDDKDVDGINNLFIGTWTEAGRIILASRATVQNEGKVAIEMLDHLAKRLGRRLHTVVYDGALHGWWLQDVMARHRVLIMTKPKARSSKVRQSDGYTACVISDSEALALHHAGQRLPLGTIVSPGPNGLKVVRSTYHRLTIAKEVAICPRGHDLWVDAGVLVDVAADMEKDRLVKRATARSNRAEPRP